ncbi:polysaccharide lyase family 8 protein [Panaeolus papilionaceus]|nr:polysaccharide lyase family 8 protein [Panaeolus papilionaceus]
MLPFIRKLAFCALTIHASFASADSDIDTARRQRTSIIVGKTTGATSIPTWLSTLGSNGKWPDTEIDYTTGCDARTASWPAQSHWSRINTLAAAWSGGLRNALQYAGDPVLRDSISLAMNYWFLNDFMVSACIDQGGASACPCDTPGFWNKNWASNIILIPGWVGQVCLLLADTLSVDEAAACQRITARAYNTFNTGIVGVSAITGANTLDIASIGIDLGIFIRNLTLLNEAFGRVHDEMTVKNGIKADGIRADGSFGQHAGILYNGNYGKDYANDLLNLELTAAGTQFQAAGSSQNSFILLLQASTWMIFRNTFTNVLHWDYSVLGRFVSLPVADNQATSGIKTNLTQIQELAALWDEPQVQAVADKLSATSSGVNIGSTVGNHMFYANDYMVHRGNSYVTTLKMYSKRTQNTECTNNQNTFGFHLSDGATYTYLSGNEYEDTFAAWDWNLIPGITVDYGATPLTCSSARKTGNQVFVGGVSDGKRGVAVMRYDNPTTRAHTWRKTWFFLDDDVQFVMIARITSTTGAPVFSVLDQRRLNGQVLVDGNQATSGNFTNVSTLWHDGIGYDFNTTDSSTSLSIDTGASTGSWQEIGSSNQPPITMDLFKAWLSHGNLTSSTSYAVYPAMTASGFQTKLANTSLRIVANNGNISALKDVNNNKVVVVFWENSGGTVTIPGNTHSEASLTVQSNVGSAFILDLADGVVTLSDPTQLLTSVTLHLSLGNGTKPASWTASSQIQTLTFDLPTGGDAGRSIQLPFF